MTPLSLSGMSQRNVYRNIGGIPSRTLGCPPYLQELRPTVFGGSRGGKKKEKKKTKKGRNRITWVGEDGGIPLPSSARIS